MKKRILQQLFFQILCLITIHAHTQPVAIIKTNPIKVYMHYMPWFDGPTNPVTGGTYSWGQHWTMANKNPNIIDGNGHRQIASNYYPLIGPYASSDPNVVEYHLLLMKLSGIDGVLVDWYGSQGSNGDVGTLLNNSNAMINSTSVVGLNFGLILEDRFWGNISNANASIAYARDNYFNKSNYIKGAGNRPLAGVFGPITYTSPGSWTTILANANQPLDFRTLWDNSSAGSNADGQYTWIYNPGSNPLPYLAAYYANRAPAQQNVMGVAYPRYNDYYAQGGWGGSNPAIPDDNGLTLNTTLGYIDQYKNSAHIDMVQCATFNDFGEGSVFEPTAEYGYRDLLRIQQYTGVSYTQSDLQQVYRLFTLRKKYANDASRQSQLNQVFNYFISLQISNAVSLMNSVDGIGSTPPVITSTATASGTAGSAFSYSITASNSPTSFGATGLSAGLSVNTSTGVISGTPTAIGTFNVTISAANTTGTGSATLAITIGNIMTCSGSVIVNSNTPPILDGTIDSNWSKAPVTPITKTTNGTKQTDFSAQWRAMYDNNYLYVLVEVKDATLKAPPYGPNPWDDDAVEIYIDGNNEKAASYDANDHQFGFDWGIVANTANMYGSATRTGIVYNIPAVSGGYNLAVKIPWSTIRGTPPANGKQIGLDININDNDGGNADKTRQATNSWFSTSNQEYANTSFFGIVPLTVCNGGTTVSAPVISSAGTASGTAGTAFNYTITASNSPASYAATGLPAGLVVNTSNGVISGTLTAAGTFNSTVSATNAGGTGTKAVTITIATALPSAPVISSAGTASGTVGAAFSYTITASNSPASYGATGLPAGLSVNTSNGGISGTPTASGTFNTTVSATNTGGTGTKAVTITISTGGDSAGVITCYKASGTITVDGNLTENGWNVTKPFSKNVTGTTNNTSTFGVLWDNTYLYIGAKVLDANLFSDSPNMWDDDAVEIYIDANNNKLTSYDGRDNQIIKGYNKSTVFTKFSIAGLQHAWATATGGYTVELAIPWSELGITAPAAGLGIGFDIGNDDDDDGGARDGQAVWNGTINNYQNTSAFGRLVLSSTVANGVSGKTVLPITQQSSADQKSVITLLPNPVTGGSFTIVAPGWGGTAGITISNSIGAIVQRGEGRIENSLLKVGVSKLTPGIYLLQLQKGTQVRTKKFFIQ